MKTKKLCDTVLEARCAKFLTQEQLGRLASVSGQLISDIERGQVLTIMPLTAKKLERALEVNLTPYVKQ